MKNKRIFLFLGIFFLFVLIVTGCSGEGESPTETESPQEASPEASPESPTEAATDQPTKTAAATIPCDIDLPGAADWPVAICEKFDDNSYGWQVESQENEFATYTSMITEGEFVVDYYASGFGGFQKTALTWFDVATAENFALSVDGRADSNSNTISWGIAFHADEEMGNFFLLSVYIDNRYAFELYENGVWTPLISQRPFEGPARGETNRLGITAEDGSFNFTINGNPLEEINTTVLDGDKILLIVSAFESARATFGFDNLVVQSK